jgi:hypothetical protein
MGSEVSSDGSGNEGVRDGRMSGEWLFRSSYYRLVTGDLSLLDSTVNKWFFEQLISYAVSACDLSLLPALRKITGDKRLGESLRQKASEASELIEECERKARRPEGLLYPAQGISGIDMARAILVGTRRPQTTEILRFLRDKSPEVRRMALYIIGKFRISEMTQEVCMCLSDNELPGDAFEVLQSMGQDTGADLRRYYLVSSGNPLISAAILRILGSFCSDENMEFIYSRLWSGSRYIRELALEHLLNCRYVANKEETMRVVPLLYEVSSTIVWLLSVKICLNRNDNPELLKEINREYSQWNSFMAGLLKIIDTESLKALGSLRHFHLMPQDDNPAKEVNEIISYITGDPQPETDGSFRDAADEEKKYRKLKKYFPSEIPGYPSVVEDIINCDYNVAGVWTKVAAIRSVRSLEDSNTRESVVALMFSREAILREEAALLISRYDRESYNNVSARLREKKHTDRIVSGEIHDAELVRSKTLFLSSFFNGIHEELLVQAAGKMHFITGSDPLPGLVSPGFVLWSFREEGAKPYLLILHEGTGDADERLNHVSGGTYRFHYLLPFTVVREFCILHPAHANDVIKLLDVNEELLT